MVWGVVVVWCGGGRGGASYWAGLSWPDRSGVVATTWWGLA